MTTQAMQYNLRNYFSYKLSYARAIRMQVIEVARPVREYLVIGQCGFTTYPENNGVSGHGVPVHMNVYATTRDEAKRKALKIVTDSYAPEKCHNPEFYDVTVTIL